jgi:hypothetical protein
MLNGVGQLTAAGEWKREIQVDANRGLKLELD